MRLSLINLTSFTAVRFCRLSLLMGLLTSFSPSASAQTGPTPAYQFLTLTTFESSAKAFAKIIITPAFEGKTEIQLEDFGSLSTDKNLAKLQHNTLLINQQLEALSSAGWELAQTYPVSMAGVLTTRYLFRKAK